MTRRFVASLLLCSALVFGAEVPRPSTDFPVVMPDGSQTNLNGFKGNVCLVEFLLVTCPHCQNTARLLSKLNTEYTKKGVKFIGVSITPNADVKTFVSTTGANFPVGNTKSQEAVYSYLQHSLMQGQFYVPQMVIMDRNGVIREQHGGTDPWLQNQEANIRATLDKLVAEAPAKHTSAAPRKKAS